jgi:branched-chain amino acid transport system substrate-binding protein
LENAINLAVMQNRNLGSGYTLKVINYDEAVEDDVDQQGSPQPDVQNMTDIARNPCIVGLVGPFKSYVALDELPVATAAGLAVISPANTNPALTLRPYAEAQGINFDQLHPPGKPINYFSIAPTDATQAVVDADVTFDLGARSVSLVNAPGSESDAEYGYLLVSDFTQAFEGKGGRIVGTDTIVSDLSVIPAIAARIVAAHPDAVFYGGVFDTVGGLLKADLVKQGYTGLFLGADNIANDAGFVDQAGVDAANGAYATSAGRDLSTFTSGAAAQFISDYAARYPAKDLYPFAANSYDAAMVLITACKSLIRAGQAVTRAALIGQVQRIQYAGVTGPISFDGNGDIAHGVFSIYTVQHGQWVYAWQVSV